MQNDISLRALLEAGCHFGHQVSRWNPKANEFIYGSREGIHIIDLVKTKKALENAYKFLVDQAGQNKTIIFVGTKRQARSLIKEESTRIGTYYISERWIGGLLTNWDEVIKNLEKIRKLEERIANVEGIYKKAEVGKFKFQLARLLKFYEGIRELKTTPDVLVVVDVKKEDNAVREAKRTGVKVVGMVDTNSDPIMADIAIPANDDAVGSLKLIINYLAEAVLEGKNLAQKNRAEVQAKLEKEAKKKEKK